MEASANIGQGILHLCKQEMGGILSWQKCKHETAPIKPRWDTGSYMT